MGGCAGMVGDRIESIGSFEGRGLLWGSCVDGGGALWFGLDGQPGQLPALCCWQGGRLALVELPGGPQDRGKGINQVVADGAGGFWCCGWQLYHYCEGTFEKIEGRELEDNYLMEVAVQTDGAILASTIKGLFRYDGVGFEQLLKKEAERWLWSLKFDSNGKLWASTNDGRLLVFEEGQPLEIGQVEGPLGYGMHIDSRERIWLGTYGMGVYCYDATRVRVFGRQQGLPSNHIHCVVEDSQGRVLVGTDDGLVGFDGERFAALPIFESLPKRGVTSLLAGENGALWLGSRNGRLWFLDLEKDTAEELTQGGNGFSLSHLLRIRGTGSGLGLRSAWASAGIMVKPSNTGILKTGRVSDFNRGDARRQRRFVAAWRVGSGKGGWFILCRRG